VAPGAADAGDPRGARASDEIASDEIVVTGATGVIAIRAVVTFSPFSAGCCSAKT